MRGLRALMVLGAMAAGACSPSQQDAEAALKEAESAITAQHADAMRFAPEAFAGVMQSYGAAREAFDRQAWGEVIAKAEEASVQARQIGPVVAEGKERVVARWPAARDSIQAMLTTIGERLDTAARTRRYPAGMTSERVQAARAEVDSLVTALGKAGAAYDQGDLAGALHAVERIRTRAGGLAATVGLGAPNPHGT